MISAVAGIAGRIAIELSGCRSATEDADTPNVDVITPDVNAIVIIVPLIHITTHVMFVCFMKRTCLLPQSDG